MKPVTLVTLGLVVMLTTCAAPPRPARAQKPPPEKAPAAAPAKTFPAAWAGTYRGELEVFGSAGKRQKLRMEFLIAPTKDPKRVRWVIGYEGQPRRDYELVTTDAAKGEYEIDEKNSIVIPARLMGDELVSVFAVSGNQLVARYRLSKDTLTFDVTMFTQLAAGTTGGKDGIPVVSTYVPQNVQRAVLERVKD
jgi:hypothetical protein